MADGDGERVVAGGDGERAVAGGDGERVVAGGERAVAGGAGEAWFFGAKGEAGEACNKGRHALQCGMGQHVLVRQLPPVGADKDGDRQPNKCPCGEKGYPLPEVARKLNQPQGRPPGTQVRHPSQAPPCPPAEPAFALMPVLGGGSTAARCQGQLSAPCQL